MIINNDNNNTANNANANNNNNNNNDNNNSGQEIAKRFPSNIFIRRKCDHNRCKINVIVEYFVSRLLI